MYIKPCFDIDWTRGLITTSSGQYYQSIVNLYYTLQRVYGAHTQVPKLIMSCIFMLKHYGQHYTSITTCSQQLQSFESSCMTSL